MTLSYHFIFKSANSAMDQTWLRPVEPRGCPVVGRGSFESCELWVRASMGRTWSDGIGEFGVQVEALSSLSSFLGSFLLGEPLPSRCASTVTFGPDRSYPADLVSITSLITPSWAQPHPRWTPLIRLEHDRVVIARCLFKRAERKTLLKILCMFSCRYVCASNWISVVGSLLFVFSDICCVLPLLFQKSC